jgi:hypothetical protein
VSELIEGSLPHLLCGLLIIARVGDVATTYVVTPTLVLEANPVVRRLGWRFAIATIALCLLPYYFPEVAVAALIASLLVSASNAGKMWIARTMGEAAYEAFLLDIARRSTKRQALGSVIASAAFIVLAGSVVMMFYHSSYDWGYWLGLGIITYGLAMALHGSNWVLRLFRKATHAG